MNSILHTVTNNLFVPADEGSAARLEINNSGVTLSGYVLVPQERVQDMDALLATLRPLSVRAPHQAA